MSNLQLSSWKTLLRLAGAFVVSALVLNANVPRGWYLAGSKPAEYEAGVAAEQAYQGNGTAFLKSRRPSVDGFGTLMQSISAEKYKGNKVRLSGLVKSEEVIGWAGLWMRVDKGMDMVVLDNMQNRPIKGTTGWQRYYVILDVPNDATGISFGILLSGPGQVWLNSTKFEIVGLEVPSTSPTEKHLPDKPVNLEFND